MTLLHRRADLRETMSDYLIDDLERLRRRRPRPQRDRRAARRRRPARGGDARPTASRLPLSFLFLFLGAAPCTDWLGDAVARDEHGFVLTGADAGADGLLETSVPGVYAAGDVRAGSTKRCATAVGEGAPSSGSSTSALAPRP